MPADRLLATLLRSLQGERAPLETSRLPATAASLLTTLSNPLNLTLLTSQILVAPAFWNRPDGLRTCIRVFGTFHSASVAILRNGEASAPHAQQGMGGGMEKEAWVKAVVQGADEKSPRWRHLLVIGGVLLGFEGEGRDALPHGLRNVLESALITAANLALDEVHGRGSLDAHCIALVLNLTFPLLSETARGTINYDALLPVLMDSVFFSNEGFQSGYFLAAIDADIVQQAGKKFTWPAKSTTFVQLQNMSTRPLFTAMGPLARLISHSIGQARDPAAVHHAVDELGLFARTIGTQWRRNKLSEVDVSEEPMFLQTDALRTTIPVLWQVLKTALFSTVTVLRGAVERILADRALANDHTAPGLATVILTTLRDLYFISSRLGANAFSATTFVSLAAIDILSCYPDHTEQFLKDIRPTQLGRIPKHPLDRCLDLNFLNTAEHVTLMISPQVSEELLIPAATPYLSSGGNPNLLEIFEAAHSVMLAVLSAPQNAELTGRLAPFYVEALFRAFPQNLSPRQFRLAFKTLIRICSPPSPLSDSHPDIPSILLELVHHRALHAPTSPLRRPQPQPLPTPPPPPSSIPAGPHAPREVALSEQAVLTMTLLDSLPFLAIPTLEEWLPLAAELINSIEDPSMRAACRERFWEVLSSGEMDVDRAAVAVAWWGTRGGRELVLLGRGPEAGGPFMHGGLAVESRL
ncbi:MAG: hypothetical protein M1832_000269 [Thelocarpon impressellum]|nr:MAG: hypothetical protein M1832_000269 [Thelocarpon impressellum]